MLVECCCYFATPNISRTYSYTHVLVHTESMYCYMLYSNPYVPWCDMCGMAATMCSRFSIKFNISHSYAWCDDVIVNKLTATFVQTILFWFLNSIEIVAITVTQKDQLKSKLIQFNPVESLHVNWQCWYLVPRTIEQTISQRDQWTNEHWKQRSVTNIDKLHSIFCDAGQHMSGAGDWWFSCYSWMTEYDECIETKLSTDRERRLIV